MPDFLRYLLVGFLCLTGLITIAALITNHIAEKQWARRANAIKAQVLADWQLELTAAQVGQLVPGGDAAVVGLPGGQALRWAADNSRVELVEFAPTSKPPVAAAPEFAEPETKRPGATLDKPVMS